MLAVEYREKAGKCWEKLGSRRRGSLCDEGRSEKSSFPVIYLGQEDMLASRAMPAKSFRKRSGMVGMKGRKWKR